MRHLRTVVRAAEAAGPGVRRITLMDPDGWPLPRAKPGAHIDLHLPGGLVRAYSLCGDPAAADRYVIAVRREAAGRGGSAAAHALREGDELAVSLPRCTFPLASDAARHVFLAGGIGVTPFVSMAHALDRSGVEYELRVLHRGPPPLQDALSALAAAGRALLHDTARGPRPDLAALLGAPAPGTHAYCCGPASMLEAFAEATAHWPAGTAHVEHFVPPPLPADPAARPFELVLARSGARAPVAAGGSVLAALRMLGADVEASCEGGVCGACRVRWLAGPPVHRDRVLRPSERATEVMVCVAGCAGERLVLDL